MPTPGISVARWTHAVRMDASTRALEPPAHAAAATYRLLAFEIEYAKILQIRIVYLSLPQAFLIQTFKNSILISFGRGVSTTGCVRAQGPDA